VMHKLKSILACEKENVVCPSGYTAETDIPCCLIGMVREQKTSMERARKGMVGQETEKTTVSDAKKKKA